MDKLVFSAALLVSLQVPQFVAHYHQYLSGLYAATKWQVDGYEATAIQHEFTSAQSMINRHLNNSEASVRTDAQQKLATLEIFNQLSLGVKIFERDGLPQKLVFMLKPAQHPSLKEASRNFEPGIPLTATGLGFSVILALLINLLLMAPFYWIFRRK
jgi:hypothetical protein